MSLTVQIDQKADFEPVLEMIQNGVLADIVDKGQVPNKFKPGTFQDKCYFVWIVEETDPEGRNKRVFESFTKSLHEKATLRKRLKELGYTDFEPGVPFDLEQLIGTKRILILSSEDAEDGGKPFIRVLATQALKKGQKGIDIPADFVRKEVKVPVPVTKRAPDRPKTPAKPQAPVPENEWITDDDIPF